MDMQPPEWLKLSDELAWPLVGMGLATLRPEQAGSPDMNVIPYLALLHFAHCLETSVDANHAGKHSVAICLVRHCIETLTLVDIGLQDDSYAAPLLEAWKAHKKSHSDLRASLETHIWPRYSTGLWDESWAEYFGNLARAVQPYAHYTHELQGWQLAMVSGDFERKGALMLMGLHTYDPLKASRITLFHSLVGWTLGRLLVAHGRNMDVLARAQQIGALGHALGRSKLLFKRKEWGVELLPDMLFKEGADWRDP